MPSLSKFARNLSCVPLSPRECCDGQSKHKVIRLSRTDTSYVKEDQICYFNTSCNNNKKSPTPDTPTKCTSAERSFSTVDQNQPLEIKSSDSESEDNLKVITDSCDRKTESQDNSSFQSLYQHFPITISSTDTYGEDSPQLVFDYDTVKSYRPPPLPMTEENILVPRISNNILEYGNCYKADISFPSLDLLCHPRHIHLSSELEPNESNQEIALECISWLLDLMEPVFKDTDAPKKIVMKHKHKYAVVPYSSSTVFDRRLHSRIRFPTQDAVIIDINQVIGNQGDALVTIQGTCARFSFHFVNGLSLLKTNAVNTVTLSVKRIKGWTNLFSAKRLSSTNLSSSLQILRNMNSKRCGSLSVVVQPVKMIPSESCVAISSFMVENEFNEQYQSIPKVTGRKKWMACTYLRIQHVAINQALTGPLRWAALLNTGMGVKNFKRSLLAGTGKRKQIDINVATKSEPSSPMVFGRVAAKHVVVIPSTNTNTVNTENIKLYHSKVTKSLSQPCLKFREKIEKPVLKTRKKLLNHKVEQMTQMFERGDFAIISHNHKLIHGKFITEKGADQGCGECVNRKTCKINMESQSDENKSHTNEKGIPLKELENPFKKVLSKCNPRSQMLNPLNGICRKIFMLAEKFIPATEV